MGIAARGSGSLYVVGTGGGYFSPNLIFLENSLIRRVGLLMSTVDHEPSPVSIPVDACGTRSWTGQSCSVCGPQGLRENRRSTIDSKLAVDRLRVEYIRLRSAAARESRSAK